MENAPLPTVEEIRALLAYYPVICAPGFEPVDSRFGPATVPEGGFFPSSPDYHPLVVEFFNVAARECWLDHNYHPEEAWQILQDEGRVKSASLETLRSLLTWCLRGEHFSEGHWGHVIKLGYIRSILDRLQVIVDEL